MSYFKPPFYVNEDIYVILGCKCCIVLVIMSTITLRRRPIISVPGPIIFIIIFHVFPHLLQNIWLFSNIERLSTHLIFFCGIQFCVVCILELFTFMFIFNVNHTSQLSTSGFMMNPGSPFTPFLVWSIPLVWKLQGRW